MARILKSIFGLQLGLDADGKLMVPKGIRIGEDGSQFLIESPNFVRQTDDFVGQVISTIWGVSKGSDGAAANFAINVAQNGTIRATSGAGAGGTMAVNGVQITGALNYLANAGLLYMEARLKLSAITNIQCFAGLTNQTSSLQAPIISAGAADTFTNNAADAVGFMFDTNMATDDWWLTGVAGSTGATNQDSKFAPVAATYEVLRVELSKTGVATFFRNGKQVGVQMAGAVTPTVALAPVIEAFTRTAASATVDIDYITCGSTRV